MNLRFNINLTVLFAILCLAWMTIAGGCAHDDNSDKIKVQQLFEHLDTCSNVGEIVPPARINQINLAEISCMMVTSDEDLYYTKDILDSIQRIRNCSLFLENNMYYIHKIPHINDTCFWRPDLCKIYKETNFQDQYLFLKKNTRTNWEIVSEYIWLYNSSKHAYEWYCKFVPFPCVDSTFLDNIKGEVIKMLCFHDYTHCYLIGEDSIPRYVDQFK